MIKEPRRVLNQDRVNPTTCGGIMRALQQSEVWSACCEIV
jgi:hypothetical protein